MNKLEYNGEKISYTLIKSKIKNLYIQIKEGKVIVKAPIRLKDEEINKFIKSKSKWIYEKLNEEKQKIKIEENFTKEDIEELKYIVQKALEKYTKYLNVYPSKIRIKDIKYAWGSCSSNKNITINLKLAKKEEKIIEYVVLHELCHLKHMNHSKQFWDLVESNMPEYKLYIKKLKQYR